ncbi:sigma-70 family RNA polymerase sigma factor [Paenibacillus sp. FSL W8-0426]|uniref:sigma-70 family RNA polymerase sigma factor n=1 Tax=Paenibacillus sp. FSL W8-0426 TaxID=2921714 RepID=UPI0030D9D3CF
MDAGLHNPALGDVNNFVEQNVGLVYKIAKGQLRKSRFPVELNDLVQEGWVGFLLAYQKYDPARETEFSTVAHTYIINQIRKYIRDKVPLIRPPKQIYEVATQILKNDLMGRDATEISLSIGCTKRTAERALSYLSGEKDTYSLDFIMNIYDGEGHADNYEIIGKEEDFSDAYAQEFFKSLNVKQQAVLALRLKGLTQTEIGQQVGVTQMSVSRMLERIKGRAKKYISAEEGEAV